LLNAISEVGQEADPLESYNNHRKEVVEGVTLLFSDQEQLKRRNELKVAKVSTTR
jgi:hypothetical protein